MPASPRRTAAIVLGSALAVSGIAAVPAPATEDFTLTRVAGPDRYATAANVALDAFGTADAAVIARGDQFPDALAGSYLTGVLGAPLLLTAPDDLPDVTAQALDTLGVSTVYLLGGTGAISDAVADEAAGGDTARTVNRVAGSNRYATAAEIATGQDPAGIGEVGDARTALLASGETFADALAAGPLAHAAGLPILLTPSSSLAPEAAAAIDELGIEHLVVVGGTAAVSPSVVDAAEAAGGATSDRVAGVTRYATAAAIADFALAELDFDDTNVDLATGQSFADALAAGPAAGEVARPLLLTTSGALAPEADGWLEDHAGTLSGGRVFGGTGAVTDAVVSAAESAASGSVSSASEGVVTFANGAANTYRFVADGADASTTVTYADGDTFVVDGAPATVGGFEGAITPGDRIDHTTGRHELTNVAANTITDGTVGNVDIENGQLDIVHPVNGDALRANIAYAGMVYRVGTATVNEASFEAEVNEGDTIAISGTGAQTTFTLTNVDVVGAAGSIEAGTNPLLPSTSLEIDSLGDDPATDDDAAYVANGGPASNDVFEVEGQASDYDGFSAALSEGDAVTYRRTSGVETFELVNRAPSVIDGQAVDGIETTTGPLPTQAGGGSFTVVTDDGPVDVTYAAGGAYVIDGRVASETELEAAYSAGDDILFRAADEPSGTTQRIELTNRVLQGPVDPDSVNTDDPSGVPGAEDPPGNSYGVLGQDGETILRQVTYVTSTASANTYFINGAAVTLAQFETELDAIAAGQRSTATVQVQTTGTGASAVTQHRLTTTGGSTTTSSTSSTTSSSTTSTTSLLPI